MGSIVNGHYSVYDKKHEIGEVVQCEKNGVAFSGTIISEGEMSYTILLEDGSERVVDHANIN